MSSGANQNGGGGRGAGAAEPRLYAGFTADFWRGVAGGYLKHSLEVGPGNYYRAMLDMLDEIDRLKATMANQASVSSAIEKIIRIQNRELRAEIDRLNALALLGARATVEAVRKLDDAVDENQELYRRLDAIEAESEAKLAAREGA